MIDYVNKILLPYVTQKRKQLSQDPFILHWLFMTASRDSVLNSSYLY